MLVRPLFSYFHIIEYGIFPFSPFFHVFDQEIVVEYQILLNGNYRLVVPSLKN